MSLTKYNTGFKNAYNQRKPFRNIQIGTVQSVDPIAVDTEDKRQMNEDKRYNADPYIIRCRIVGSDFDNDLEDSKLPNCFPLTPKHTAVVPKVGELVLVFIFGEDEKFSDRFYIGPIISRPSKMNIDTLFEGAQSGLDIGILNTIPDISKIESAKGIYSEYDSDNTLAIEGRNNADMVFKDNEVIIRAGKFVLNQPLVFNDQNPAYFQIKSDFQLIDDNGELTGSKISVANIVANKINLLTYDGGDPQFDLTIRDLAKNLTPYIDDEQLNSILSSAHPLVFGDVLVLYLQLLKQALVNHVHNGVGNKPTDRTDQGPLALEDFITNAETLERAMLSRNVRTN